MQASKTVPIEEVRKEIMEVDAEARKKHPWLKYQTTIAVLIAFGAITGFICSSLLYLKDYIPAWLCIIINAFFCSFIHELEHDTFHVLYFKKRPKLRNSFLGLLWVFKPNTINPWVRRVIHLHHHKHSGTPEDQEERLIGNGLPYTIKRFCIMIDPIFALVQFKHLHRDSKKFRPYLLISSLFPMHFIFLTIVCAWVSFHFVVIMNYFFDFNLRTLAIIIKNMHILDFLMVVYIAPAVLRVFCLQFISSSIHYYGGVDAVIKQTQVIDKWYLKPMQWLCCSFGETHAIHHICVNQPFYLRHITKKDCHAILQKYGVRFNDVDTFNRCNHYNK